MAVAGIVSRVRAMNIEKALSRAVARGGLHVDIGGEARFARAINVNPGTLTTTTGAAGRRIPNLVQAVGEQLPVRSHLAQLVTVENTPLRSGAAGEIARLLAPGGEVFLRHPVDYGRVAHNAVAASIHGSMEQAIVGEALISRIVAVS